LDNEVEAKKTELIGLLNSVKDGVADKFSFNGSSNSTMPDYCFTAMGNNFCIDLDKAIPFFETLGNALFFVTLFIGFYLAFKN